MSVLQPYLDSGVLVCLSGQTDIMQAVTPGWSTENAQFRMENLIAAQDYGPYRYGTYGARLDIVLCSNDSTAQGVTTALINAGYTPGSFPLITGQDCEIVSVRNIMAGTQAMSVFKDTRILAHQVTIMADAILSGCEPPINDVGTYHNGTGIIPAFLCAPYVVNRFNAEKLLIESGYYTWEQLGLGW
jgi:putative multiple sugar transport system substrate-binding protein